MRKSPPNKYKVPNKEWTKWFPEAQELFNELYKQMGDVDLFVFSKDNKQFRPYWETARWNCSWTAASELTLILKEDASERLGKVVLNHVKKQEAA
jgi:hypothetical protein